MTNGGENTATKIKKKASEKKKAFEQTKLNVLNEEIVLKKRIQEIMDESDSFGSSDAEMTQLTTSKDVKKRARVISDSDSE